jgi:hypothetical protein
MAVFPLPVPLFAAALRAPSGVRRPSVRLAAKKLANDRTTVKSGAAPGSDDAGVHFGLSGCLGLGYASEVGRRTASGPACTCIVCLSVAPAPLASLFSCLFYAPLLIC